MSVMSKRGDTVATEQTKSNRRSGQGMVRNPR
jgi:hypothetical protein